jgi:hypothetical protein
LWGCGDVLLAFDEVDVGGKVLQEIKYYISTKINAIDRRAFVNKEWFNYRDKNSVQVRDKIMKNG